MKVIPREVRRITYSAKIRDLKTRLTLSPDQKSLVIGSLLGDGYLEPNWSKTNYRLKVQHSVAQRDYVLWKHSLLSDWVLTEPKGQLVNHSIRFRTISHPELTKFRELFYSGNEKIVPEDIVDYLDPLALAVWFMDDGNVKRWNGQPGAFHLNSQSFSLADNKVLARALLNRYKLRASLENNHGYTRLYIGKSYVDRFAKIVRTYVISSMSYKLS